MRVMPWRTTARCYMTKVRYKIIRCMAINYWIMRNKMNAVSPVPRVLDLQSLSVLTKVAIKVELRHRTTDIKPNVKWIHTSHCLTSPEKMWNSGFCHRDVWLLCNHIKQGRDWKTIILVKKTATVQPVVQTRSFWIGVHYFSFKM